jgi:hypothetical protein
MMDVSKEEKEKHLFKLAKALIAAICPDSYYSTPSIDAKYPFGDSTPEIDVARIIELEPAAEDGHTREQFDYCRKLLCIEVVPFIHKRCKLVLK